MRSSAVFNLAVIITACLAAGLFPRLLGAQTPAPVPTQEPAPPAKPEKPAVFRVKYISDTTLYIDAGHNAGLQEGMKLSVVEPPPDGVVNEGIRYREYPRTIAAT